MKQLSEEERWEIVSSMKKVRNIPKTARQVGCSREAVRRWWGVYKATGGVSPKKSSGRKPLLSKAAGCQALDLLADNKLGGASAVAGSLKAQGVTRKVVDRKTIVRAARKAAREKGHKLMHVRGKPAKGITEKTRLKRIHFAKANAHRDWRSVMFTDRSKFHFRYPGSQAMPGRWVLSGIEGSEGSVFQPSHPQVLNIYAGITRYGVTALHIVAGSSKHKTMHTNLKGAPAKNITKAEFKKVLKETLLKEGKRIFSAQGISSWVLQLDGDKAHGNVGEVVREWNQEKGASVSVLSDWPPNSPDLNPIENIWSWTQQQVNKKGCKTFEEFEKEVKWQLSHVPETHLRHHYNSMSKRLKDVLVAKGGYISY
jgi:DDE superfamily endonuclease